MSAPLAVLRFPRRSAQAKGRYAVVTPDGGPVLAADVGRRGHVVDLTAPDAAPVGRILQGAKGAWSLIAPGSGAVVAAAETRRGIRVRIGNGPETVVDGRGDEWDLLWEQTRLLAARKTPRKEAKRCLDVWVTDQACTPPVVAFVVHVQRFVHAADDANQFAVQQSFQANQAAALMQQQQLS